MRSIKIYASGKDTAHFAAEELARLLKTADPEARIDLTYDPKNSDIKVGIGGDLPQISVCDPEIDDAIEINITSSKGYITGSNERSVLFGVYKLLTHLGAKFIRPGRSGEIIPRLDAYNVTFNLKESPAARYRGICLEGSAGKDHIIDMIDYMPKIGLNIFFTQLWRPSFVFRRWYKGDDTLSAEDEDKIVLDYSRELVLRSLNHHKMGHGWIPHALGEECGLWHAPSDQKIPRDEHTPFLALVDGKRALFNGSAVDTNLCYSNSKARGMIIREVVDYAERKGATDLHVWLADQPSNQCECINCRDTLPSDFYVMLLNELDEELTAKGLNTKIYILAYLELLWAPLKEKIRNQERFTLLFAPIRRPYYKPLIAQREGKLIPFIRNVWTNPADTFSSLIYLDEWKKNFFGDSILFDYHLMWDVYNDLTGESAARMLSYDMAHLPEAGLQGMISCQGIRLGIVGDLATHFMANSLWSGKEVTEEEIKDYYRSAYGENSELIRSYLSVISRALSPNMLRGKDKIPYNLKDLIDEAICAAKKLSSIVKDMQNDLHIPYKVSYGFLSHAVRLYECILDFLLEYTNGASDKGLLAWKKVISISAQIEKNDPMALDAFEFLLVWHRHILKLFFPDFEIDYATGELTM